MQLAISAATEGFLDEIAVTALCQAADLSVHKVYNCRGKTNLDQKIPAFNQAARGWYWLILRDMDHDADCAPQLRGCLLPDPSRFIQLRIVVRELEAWLLGDGEKFGDFFGISTRRIPSDPESLDDPKSEVIRLAQISRKRIIREDIVPRPGSGAKEGPAYSTRLAEFIDYYWRPDVAASACDSLRRSLDRMREWAQA